MKFTMNVPGMSLYPGRARHWWQEISSEEIVRVAQTADALGFDYLTVSEHFVLNRDWSQEMGSRWVHSLSAAGFLLGSTKRIKVLCLLVIPYHQPIELAKALATLDFVSGGRNIPIAMVGYNDWEFEALGVPFDQRGAVTDEYLDAMTVLWADEHPRFHGEHVRFEGIVFDPKPSQEIPIWVGGRTKATMRRLARVGAGWLSYVTPRSEFPAMVRYAREQPEFAARPRLLELSLPLFEGKRDPYSHEPIEQAPIVLERDAILEQVHEIAACGANVTSADDVLGTGKFQNDLPGAPPPVRDIEEYLERLHWFAEEILPAGRLV
jgi:probable F420-dependent oxidoreductase